MRDKELKKLLRDNVTPPDYIKKNNFIRENRSKEIWHVSTPRLILQQAGYIRKRVWIASLILMAFTAWNILQMTKYDLGEVYTASERIEKGLLSIAVFIPFFASFGMIESLKAQIHGVYELEQATIISGKRAFFARMTAVGIVNIITFILVAVFSGFAIGVGILRSAVVIFIPYLLTMILCIEFERFEWARRNAFACIVPAIIVLFLELYSSIGGCYTMWDMKTLLLIFAALIAVFAYELKRIDMMEEFAWN